MATFDENHKFYFGGLRIPYSSFTIELKTPSHKHKYPHTPAAALEKMGREPYEFSVNGSFDDCLTPEILPLNWTETLAELRGFAEDESTEDTVIPLIGTIRAVIQNLRIEVEASRRSGPKSISFTLLEDASEKFAGALLIDPNKLLFASKRFKQLEIPAAEQSWFSKINDAVAAVMAIKDQALLYGSMLESKLLYLIDLIKWADKTIEFLDDPENWQIVGTLHELWESMADLLLDRLQLQQELKIYVVVRDATLQQIAVAISQLAGHPIDSGDLLGLNLIADPFAVPAGSKISYYP
jgi:hypothetical protein